MKFLISVPFSIHVTVEADSADDITDDQVTDAVLTEHGKYPHVDVRNAGEFVVLDTIEATS